MLIFHKVRSILAQVGPGIAIAATGLGAADLVSVTVAGSRYGNLLVWAVVVGAVLKYVLNEGVARWQLATGLSVFEGWARYLSPLVVYYFLAYLLLWTFFVSGGLMVAAGLAAHSLLPGISRQWWGLIHALVGFILVWIGTYERFEQVMKVLVALMFAAIIGCVMAVGPRADSFLLLPTVPQGSLPFTLGLIGGVGGSVTILAYGYWIREKKWIGITWFKSVRTDLGIAYCLTGLFGIGAMLLATEVLFKQGIRVEGQGGVIRMASILQHILGTPGQWLFLIGFWGAAFSSILGIFQGVPYLFADYMFHMRGNFAGERNRSVSPHGRYYRLYLIYMTFPCMLMLFVERPIWVIVIYAAVSSLFLPFLALTLLFMNNRVQWVGKENRNGLVTNLLLVAAVSLFI
ncbi:Nramp family divalent metal transporter, partial [Acidobacteria bacterium AH-259-A15]|nr:Nramp family divalent metal transporter [Acidobacteria bacterium AH-259-A15]